MYVSIKDAVDIVNALYDYGAHQIDEGKRNDDATQVAEGTRLLELAAKLHARRCHRKPR